MLLGAGHANLTPAIQEQILYHTYTRGHPLIPTLEVTVSGGDGDDAQHYQEREVRQAIEALELAKRQQKKGQP